MPLSVENDLMQHRRPLIHLETPKAMTPQQELDLVRMAFARSASPANRSRLCAMLMHDEAFADIIALLGDPLLLDYAGAMALGSAALALADEDALKLALDATQRASDLACTDPERAAALAMHAKCMGLLGDVAGAEAGYRAALAQDPGNRDACRRLAASEFSADRPQSVLDFTDALFARGVRHTSLFAARTVALARLGNVVAARETGGFAAFHHVGRLTPPAGWASLDAFNAALAAELLAHPAMRVDRTGSASVRTRRLERPARRDTPLFLALRTAIAQMLADQVAALWGHSEHSWAALAPDEARLRFWCVITGSDGYEDWHVHPYGWLSGAYYVAVPNTVVEGDNRDGCMMIGLPETLAGQRAAADFGEHVVRPVPGLLMTFPSHCYHRTFEHNSDADRICVSFDLRPT